MTIKELVDIVDPATEYTVVDNESAFCVKKPGDLWELNELVIKSVSAIDTRHLLIIVE